MKNENNGWMDLTKHWAFKHGFLHACRHRPQQTNPAGEREPVPNHGLAAVTLILRIAFALSSAFVLRHSKLVRRHHLTAIAVAAQWRAWVSKTPPSIRAPSQAPSGTPLPEMLSAGALQRPEPSSFSPTTHSIWLPLAGPFRPNHGETACANLQYQRSLTELHPLQ